MASATASAGSARGTINMALFYIFLIVFVLVSVFPLLWMFKMSIITQRELFATPPTVIPQSPTSSSYGTIFGDPAFQKALLNSTIIAGVTTVICLFLGSIAAYAIARLRFRLKSSVMTLILAISFFPQVAIIAPLFIQFSNVGLDQHLLVGDHRRYGLRPAAYGMATGGVLQGTAQRPRRGGESRRRDGDPGVPQGDSSAGGSRGVHDCDPDVHLRLERLPLCQHVPLYRGYTAGDGRDPEVRHGVYGRLRCAGCGSGGGDGAFGYTGTHLPAQDRLWPDRRGGKGINKARRASS